MLDASDYLASASGFLPIPIIIIEALFSDINWIHLC